MDAKCLKKIVLFLLCGSAFHSATAFYLGDGYQPSSGAMFQSCLKRGGVNAKNFTSWNNPQGTLELTEVQSFDELKKLLSAGGSLSVETVQFSGSAEGNYLNSMDTSSRTVHILYFLEASYNATLDLTNDESPLIPAKATIYNRGDIQGFSQMCGTDYIGMSKAKASVLIDIVIKFKNTQSKEAFDAKISASVNTGGAAKIGLTGKLNMATTSSNGEASITFKAKQFGGDPSLLSEALLNAPGSTEGAAVVKCGSGEANSQASCDQMVQNAIGYGGRFSEQLKKVMDGVKVVDYSTYYYSDPTYFTYASLLGAPDDSETLPAKEVVDEMATKYDETKFNSDLLNEYLLRVGIGEGGQKTSGYLKAEAHLAKLKVILEAFNPKGRNTNMNSCLQKLDKQYCDKALTYILDVENQQQSGLSASMLKAKRSKLGGAAVPSNGKWLEEEDMLGRIQNNNFDIDLLTLKSPSGIDASTQKTVPAQFQQMKCSVIPIGAGDLDNSVRIDCPNIIWQSGQQKLTFEGPKGGISLSQGIDTNYNLIKLGVGEDSAAEPYSDFHYGVTDGKGQRYCFLYKGGIRLGKALDKDGNPSQFGDYTGTADIMYTAVAESAVPECPVDAARYTNKVLSTDMANKTNPNIVQAEEQELTRYYPNIQGAL